MSRLVREHRDVLSRYFADIRGTVRTSRCEEATLTGPARGGRGEAVDRLVVSNLSLVVKIAKAYRGFGVPFEDLLGEGNLGLIEAARRFDGARGTRFGTYAGWWIRKRLMIALREQSGVVRLPQHRMRRLRALRAAEQALRGLLGREPERAEVSRRLEVDPGVVDRLCEAAPKLLSLDAGVGKEGSRTVQEVVHDPRLPSAESALIHEESKRALQRAFVRLSDQERYILASRAGFADERPRTLREIGEQLALSRERVRQIEKQAHGRLRRDVQGRGRPGRSDPRAEA